MGKQGQAVGVLPLADEPPQQIGFARQALAPSFVALGDLTFGKARIDAGGMSGTASGNTRRMPEAAA